MKTIYNFNEILTQDVQIALNEIKIKIIRTRTTTFYSTTSFRYIPKMEPIKVQTPFRFFLESLFKLIFDLILHHF